MPKPACVYVAYNANDEVLYVGVTNHIRFRFGGHRQKSMWYPEMCYFKAGPMMLRDDALALERETILLLRPKYNVFCRGREKLPTDHSLRLKRRKQRYDEMMAMRARGIKLREVACHFGLTVNRILQITNGPPPVL